ncbi:MAG: hypothetical protein ACI82J_001380 [Sulfitobacter litoralis]|jgi:hypothetical protein|tara:strand:+ start:471 stop:866 length:396 start_codon:yes stop_codon:yes gene_type:complete
MHAIAAPLCYSAFFHVEHLRVHRVLPTKETIMKPVISALTLALGLGAVAAPALASDVCMPAQELKASLVDWYGETPVEGQDDSAVQIWASDNTGTWSAVKTLSNGMACVTAQGQNWMAGMKTDQMVVASAE